MLACIEGATETVQLLIESKANVNEIWAADLRETHLEGNHTALSIAAALSSPQVTSCLLNSGAETAAFRDNEGNSLIGIAAVFGNHEVIPVLAENGVSVQGFNLRGDCPLICAMLTQNPEVVRSLLEHQANPNVRSSFGLTPLSIAAVQGLVKHATYLLEAGADVQGALGTSNSVANRRKSVLGATLARQRKPSHSTLSLYRDRSVDEILAGTPLHFAAFSGNWPMAELLLSRTMATAIWC
eukprot:Skav214670  [mRNA]  locus=scaffold923:401972:415828:+ [translate_table: standard]